MLFNGLRPLVKLLFVFSLLEKGGSVPRKRGVSYWTLIFCLSYVFITESVDGIQYLKTRRLLCGKL